MQIIVVKNYSELSRFAASLVMDQLKKKKSSVLGLATGNTMIGMYKELVKANKLGQVSFKKATTFNLDEFVGLPETHKGTLYSFMRKYFFDKVDLNPDNIHFLDCEAIDPKKECKDYEKQIKKYGPIDLQFLGIGSNGHLAWCEPGTNLKSRTGIVDLKLSSRKAQLGNFESLKDEPRQAYSMGLGTIMEAKKLILMASGKGKAEIIKKALYGKVSKDIPASIIQKHKDVVVILDREAASELTFE